MLKDLLDTLESGKTVSLQEIADAQHCGIETVRAGLTFLEHLGYIRKSVPPSCQERRCYGCGGCGFAGNPPVIWEKKGVNSWL